QTIIWLPVQTPVWLTRTSGALVVLVSVQLSVEGSYRPPVLYMAEPCPPQTIILLPVQMAVCQYRASGALSVLVAVQLSVAGSYPPPVLRAPLMLPCPPQTTI